MNSPAVSKTRKTRFFSLSYNDFKKADRTVTDFSYAVIYNSIKKKFKCKWDYVPTSRFPELIKFLQHKIDGTILGKNRRRQGLKNYSTYDEYLAGYRSAATEQNR